MGDNTMFFTIDDVPCTYVDRSILTKENIRDILIDNVPNIDSFLTTKEIMDALSSLLISNPNLFDSIIKRVREIKIKSLEE